MFTLINAENMFSTSSPGGMLSYLYSKVLRRCKRQSKLHSKNRRRISRSLGCRWMMVDEIWAGKLEIVYLGGEIRCIAWCKGAVVYVNDAYIISSCESLKETLAYFGQCVFIDMYTYTRHIFHLETLRTTDIHWACFKNSSRDSIAVMSRWSHHCWWWKLNGRIVDAESFFNSIKIG